MLAVTTNTLLQSTKSHPQLLLVQLDQDKGQAALTHTLQSCWLLATRQLLQLTQSQRLIRIRVLQKLPGQALGLDHNAAVVPK